MTPMTIQVIGAVAGGLSALAWLASAIITTPLPMGYLSGPPEWVVKKIKWQSGLNAFAAAMAAVTVGCQAWLLWTTPACPTC